MKRFNTGFWTISFFFLFALAITAQEKEINHSNDDISDFCKSLTPVGRILETEDYYVWCVAPIYDEDGKVHVFYSRWPSKYGMGGWIHKSEIAHAIADKPEGPYTHVETVLAPRPGFWDATTCHNPHIQKIGKKYYLFYMGNSNGKTDTKRIGVAVAKSLNGPWKRPKKPLLEVSEKGSIRGNRKYGLAISNKITGSYKKYDGNPIVDFSSFGNNRQVEDAYVWYENGIFKMLMRDMGFFDHTVGLYVESKDGINWGKPKIGWLGAEHYISEPPAPSHLKRYGRFERPQLLMKDGHPTYMFNAMQGGKFQTASGFVFKINP